MSFIFQQPGTAKLLQAIDGAALNANSGGGFFAFASKGGIDELFGCSHISLMLQQGGAFQLIVGIDAITNAEALLCLSEKVSQFQNLTVNVFLHSHPNSTFHPKFSWFKEGNSLRLVTGSGNLTLRGLGQISTSNPPSGNWEAFVVQSLEGADVAAFEQEITDWLNIQRNAGALCELDDEQVRNRAMANGRVRFVTTPVGDVHTAEAGSPVSDLEVLPLDGIEFDTPEVLVRELSRNRPGQADVGQAALTEFFGYQGVAKNIFIQHVACNNDLGPTLEIRLFISLPSANYRLELRATSALEYIVADDDGRMILVATKLDRSSFRYVILPVTDVNYSFVTAILGPISIQRVGRPMREKRITPEELLSAWPNVPANLLPLNSMIPEP